MAEDPNQLGNADETTAAAKKSDPAASMSLLQTILDSALDPGYSKAAAKEHADLKLWRKIGLLLAIILLAVGTTVAVKNLRLNDESIKKVHDSLLSRVTSRQQTLSELSDEIDLLAAQVRQSQTKSQNSTSLEDSLAVAAAVVPVTGDGIVVLVEDSEALQTQGKGLVRDVDLRLVTNILWEAGAEAISVGDIRLGPTTTIRTAGAAILVDLEALSSPYEIKAIGDPTVLMDALSEGSDSQKLKDQSAQVGFGFSAKRESAIYVPGRELLQTESVRPLTSTSASGEDKEGDQQ